MAGSGAGHEGEKERAGATYFFAFPIASMKRSKR
jgi:hypothetical protein